MPTFTTPPLLRHHPLAIAGRRWATSSQEGARRNAMLASTMLAARRLERLEVEEFVRAHLSRAADQVIDVRRLG